MQLGPRTRTDLDVAATEGPDMPWNRRHAEVAPTVYPTTGCAAILAFSYPFWAAAGPLPSKRGMTHVPTRRPSSTRERVVTSPRLRAAQPTIAVVGSLLLAGLAAATPMAPWGTGQPTRLAGATPKRPTG
jgi:hypothetical protein